MSQTPERRETDPRLLAIKFALMKTLGPRAPLTRSAVKAVEEEHAERRETIIAHIMMALEDMPGNQRTAVSKAYNAALPEICAFHRKHRKHGKHRNQGGFVRPDHGSRRALNGNSSP